MSCPTSTKPKYASSFASLSGSPVVSSSHCGATGRDSPGSYVTVVNNDARNSRSQGSNDRFPTRSAVRFGTSLFFAAEISEEKTRVGGSRVVSRVNGAKSPGSTVVRARSSSESEDSEPEARAYASE
jgi:hypothetical protein